MERSFPRNDALRFGWEVARQNIRFFAVVLIIMAAVSYFFSLIDNSFPSDQVVPRFIVNILNWIVSSITGIGLIRIGLNFVDKKESQYIDLFSHYDRTVNYMAGSILYGLAIAIGLILLIIPGIYFGIRFQFFSYFIVEKNVGPVQALRMSWNLTKDLTWKLFVYGLIVMGINILGALALLLGLFLTIPTTQVATAYLFRHLSKK